MKRLITLSLLYCPILLSAQGYQVQVQGQKQQAMGNAGTALIQDGAAIFYNPGGVSFLKENSISAGGNAAIVNTSFRDSLTGQVTNSKIPVATPITFYAVYGVDSTKAKVLQNFKFGLGVYTPFGGSANYPSGWTGRYVLNSLDLKVINIQPTVSYKINDKIGLGVGFVYSTGSIAVNKDLYLSTLSGGESTANITAKLAGYGVNAGVYFKPTDDLSIGLSYRSQMKLNSSGGQANFTVPASLKDSVPSGAAKLTFPTPTVISLGFGYKVTDKFSLALDINYIGFKIFDTLRVQFANQTGSLKNIADPRGYKNTYSFQLGGQYKVIDALAVRLGIRYALTPIPNGYTTAEGADSDHLILCGGLGYNINKHFTVDASYSFESIYRKDHNNFYGLVGEYKTYASIAGMSLSYKF